MYLKHFLAPFYHLLLICTLIAGIPDAGKSGPFKRIGPFGGDVRSLLIDAKQSSVVYLGTSNGMIYKSIDSGNSWTPLYPGIGQSSYVIDTLIQHPNEQNRIYAGAWDLHSEGGGLFESQDAGINWTRMTVAQISTAVRGLAICRSKPAYMIAGTLSGAYVSADAGQSWNRVGGDELQKAESVAIDPVDPRILYVGTWRLGYKSSDFGKTWIRLENGMPLDSDVFSIAIDAGNPNTVYSSACSGVYRSSNQARSWTRLRLLPDRFTVRAQVVYLDPSSSQRVYSGTTEGLFVSNNNGQNWTRLTAGSVTVNAIQVDPGNNQRILIGTEYEGVLLSEDKGRTWKESNAGFIHRRISWIIPDPITPGRIMAGLASGKGGMYSHNVRSGDWKALQIIDGMRILSYLNLPNKRGRLAGTVQGLFWQANDAAQWTKLKGSISKRAIYSLLMDPGNPVIYAGTDQGIYRASLSTMDFRLPPGYRLSPQVWCIAAPDKGAGLIYAGSSLGLLRSWDRGVIWNVVYSYGLPERAPIESIAVSPSDKDHLFAGTSIGLYESINGGVHWRRVGDSEMGKNIPSVVFAGDSANLILAADGDFGGVFYSNDGGDKWKKISGEYKSPVTSLAVDPQQPSSIYVGTQFDGVYLLNLPQ
jgi:photosystem II stability/assembly factor-like uncharacterized protein